MLKIERKQYEPLDDIANAIGDICIKWGRIGVTCSKEKYYTVRVYCSFGVYSLHSLIWPNYCYKHPKYPLWLWKLDIHYLNKLLNPLNKIIIPYQKMIYKYAYWKYIKNYPHLFDEITSCADYDDVLGFKHVRLCSKHSIEYKKTCILDSERCEECQIS